ncbi:MAG: hypothetical protein M0R80_30920 [Proteobacteria bacterium]|jgi:hypothetical protein|nr:hypothetical protein [Pseudomonadota bacterium]
MTRNKLVGLSLAICAALAVTTVVSSAEALTCNVTDIRVTTRTLNSDDVHPAPLVVDGAEVAEGNIMFYFGTATTWTYGFALNNSGVEDFRQGAIDEFTQHYSTSLPVFPTHFQRIKIGSLSTTELWGMAGFKVEIKCSGQSAWWGIYTNRGLNKVLGGLPNFGSVYSTSVGVAGTDSYNGDHEVFWLMNIGDHDADGIPDDLANCNSGGDVKCRVQAILSDANRNDIANAVWPLTESWWDMGNSTFVNPLQAQQPGEYHEEPDPLNPANTIDVYTTDNIWRWFYTSNGQDPILHSAIASARLRLDQCTMPITDCTMQTNYVHATALQAWGKQSYTPYPYFRSHIYEGDFNTTDAGGWLTVTGAADVDFVATYNKRYYGFSGTHWHVENTQDSEHMTQQFKISCGYKSTDMILSTRGFPYENIATDPQFDDPAFAGAETWEEAIAVAHLVWGYKTMCCGSWDCCDDASDCTSSLSGNPKCTAANIADWWTKPRCLHDGVDKWCFDEIGDYDDDGDDRWGNPIIGVNRFFAFNMLSVP